jgi:uncharacterized repeat protein (TIGR01451 family)
MRDRINRIVDKKRSLIRPVTAISKRYIRVASYTSCRMLTFSVLLLTVVLHQTEAKIKVAINSGNPAYPIPQFQPYKNPTGTLNNLATHNSCGVPHAELEKTIREGYQIQMNRASKPGGGVGGIDYIKYASNPQCSEGDGYGLLGAAAMADKQTFDGMWLYIHDFTLNKVKRYSDCKDASPGYAYSQLPGWTGAGANSATDGDVDIGVALLCAYYQWGEFMGINDACGDPISYKQEAINFLKGLSDTLSYSNGSLLSGDIGIDGYFKGGDSWAELSGWATAANTPQIGITKRVEQPGPTKQHIDYTAPAYFHQFANFLAALDSAKYAWNIFQFRRATASSNWLMQQLYSASQKNIPFCGWVDLSSTNQATFSQFNEGEDFRCPWRTILNAVWDGNINYSWDPVTHKIIPGTVSTTERDFGVRYAKFLWDPRSSPWNNSCVTGANDLYPYWGPAMLWTDWDLDGSGGNFFFQNWIHGTGSPSAVLSQDFQLMGEMYRQLEIEFNVDDGGTDGYLDATPFYFHGWFRQLGLLVLTGNYPAPSDLKPSANMKVYLDIDKTFAFEKDTVTYTIDYRNYGSLDATGTIVVDTLHRDFSFVSATGGGVYNNSAHTVTWNVGAVPGFKTATGITPTVGQVKLKVVIANATQKQYRNKASISCDNGSGWTTNDYPNRVTAVMERNYLDIAKRALICKYSASKTFFKPGETVEFTIDFENSSDAGWINGGRPGVNFSFSQVDLTQGEGPLSAKSTMRFRLFNDATEAYIDFGNYRVSYFLYDETHTCVINQNECTSGWGFTQTITEGLNKANVKLVHESIVPGQDAQGKWNQRLIVQFSDPTDPNRIENLTTIDHHLAEYRGMRIRIHRGGIDPCRLVWFFNSSDWKPVDWSNAWSWNPDIGDKDDGIFFPITNDWTDPDKPDVPVTTWNRKSCKPATKTVNNILVEEWDGYTWRRVAGNGPMPGREVTNVVIRDTIPEGFSFVAFTGNNPMGIAPKINGRVVSWSVPKMQIKEGGTIKFTAKADGSCPGTSDREVFNKAWISADKESPFADSSLLTVSCDTILKPPTPDHIDIVLDTITFDRYHDEGTHHNDLDAGNLSLTVYAILRDKTGKFIKFADNAAWSSQYDTVATVKNNNANKSVATITKVDKGSTFIFAKDPSLPGQKVDTIAIKVIPTPPWPSIAEAIMLDKNADLIPDSMKIKLNRPFQTNQKLDSVVVFYRGEYHSLAVSEVNVKDTVITFSLNNLTVVDARPSGTVTLKMTVDGSSTQASKSIVDGIGPAILEARLYESTDRKNDTLLLVFSEEVHTMNFDSKTLQLVKSGSNDTVAVSVLGATPAGIYIQTRVALSQQNGSTRPEVGDYIRFLPGEKGGNGIDVSLNLTHLKNRAVVIKSGPPSIVKAWYTDNNADGVVKDIYVRFLRSVDISNISFTVNWRDALASNIKDKSLSYHNSDSSIVHVVLPDSFTNTTSIRTSGKIFLKPEFLSTHESQTGLATDSTAPVILHALISPAASTDNEKIPDTLTVVFSEPVSITNTTKPFVFTSQNNVIYTINLSFLSVKDTIATFLINDYDPTTSPSPGDSIRIYTNAVKDTSGNIQSYEHNRNAIISFKQGTFDITIKAGPNPLNTNGNAITITAIPGGKIRTNISLSAKLTIFDNLGNSILPETSMLVDPKTQEATYEWKGLNRRGRKVGTGTYIALVKAKSVFGEKSEKIKIGVRNEPVDKGN